MAILLLAYGDPTAKDMLRNAIETRYGLRPPGIQTLHISFHGRTKMNIGPMSKWVTADCTAFFRFPNGLRWDYAAKPFGLPVQNINEAYNGDAYRIKRGGKVNIITEAPPLNSLRARLWTLAALLLTPLGDQAVKLGLNDDGSFSATHTELEQTVNVRLRADNTVDQAQTICYNPETKQQQTYTLRTSPDTIEVGDLILPSGIQALWDNTPWLELKPLKGNYNIDIPTAAFRDTDFVTA